MTRRYLQKQVCKSLCTHQVCLQDCPEMVSKVSQKNQAAADILDHLLCHREKLLWLNTVWIGAALSTLSLHYFEGTDRLMLNYLLLSPPGERRYRARNPSPRSPQDTVFLPLRLPEGAAPLRPHPCLPVISSQAQGATPPPSAILI